MSITESPEWKALADHYKTVESLHLRGLFASDQERGQKFSLEAEKIYLDYSKNLITDETVTLLIKLADSTGLKAAIEAMFRGDRINTTEDRPVLHIALRNRSNTPILVDGKDVMPEINSVLSQMRSFSGKIRSGEWTGYTGKRIKIL
jgi:glucose-6-phosphate isomerase